MYVYCTFRPMGSVTEVMRFAPSYARTSDLPTGSVIFAMTIGFCGSRVRVVAFPFGSSISVENRTRLKGTRNKTKYQPVFPAKCGHAIGGRCHDRSRYIGINDIRQIAVILARKWDLISIWHDQAYRRLALRCQRIQPVAIVVVRADPERSHISGLSSVCSYEIDSATAAGERDVADIGNKKAGRKIDGLSARRASLATWIFWIRRRDRAMPVEMNNAEAVIGSARRPGPHPE